MQRTILTYRQSLVGSRSRLITTSATRAMPKKDDEGSVTKELKGKDAGKPYNEPASTSATTDEIKEKDTSFDPSTVDPKEEMKEMAEETDTKESPLDWSAANEDVSPQHKK
ncbi:hypothetical protein BCR43DRAFT_512181 [Syncephalastrum racemosum]|uniref:Uncharacterized protein n=1 Tax=Syncephalastrum racemosum TaxID=13706 RepID=A0A1X2HPK5_SYNRA|nr:hypothetical protein BCR43DRAFT_512181 [Syncephalastrum racemosum]